MFDYQNSEDLQELREYIESIQAKNKVFKESLKKIILTTPRTCSTWWFGCGDRKLKCADAEHCKAVCIAKKALNKTSL